MGIAKRVRRLFILLSALDLIQYPSPQIGHGGFGLSE